jgi:signal transduction histidine kinase
MSRLAGIHVRSRRKSHYWGRILLANVIAAGIVLFAFSGVTWRTPPSELFRGFLISFLFATCIGSMLGVVMPRVSPRIWQGVRFPLNWIAAAATMTAVAMIGSAVAIGILVAIGAVAAGDFGDWMIGSARISIAITLTLGMVVTGYELMRARVAQYSAEARLASLEARVQPHFLFNTLNSIAALIHDDPKGAERMTGQLASLLRSSLDQRRAVVPLDDELRTVRDYLAIEQVRFGERLRWTLDVDPAAAGVGVPRLAIQTLVENAVKFAVTPRRGGGQITIRAAALDGRVHVRVEDDGPGFEATPLPEGHGLALLNDRLALLFGDSSALRIDSRPGLTAVTMVVPEQPVAASDGGAAAAPCESPQRA